MDTDSDLGVDTDSLDVSSRLRGIGTLRLRGGVVVDNLLLYLTGGLAHGRFDRSYSQIDLNGPATETFSTSVNKWGWTAGFGTEWALWDKWTLQTEVLYAQFKNDTVTFNCTVFCGASEPKRFEHRDSAWIGRIGLNYRFDWGKGPVMAKY